LGELLLPANEPGSSIMPGKVNPTQCEAMVMSASRFSPRTALSRSPAARQLRAQPRWRPIVINNFLHSATILADACEKLRLYCVEGTTLHVSRSTSTSTARSCWSPP